jgi:hypothetical protein
VKTGLPKTDRIYEWIIVGFVSAILFLWMSLLVFGLSALGSILVATLQAGMR